MSILDLYCSVDAFWQVFEPLWEREQVAHGQRRRRATRLSPSEIMTILILFQQSGYRSVCKNARIAQRQVFRVDAHRGKTSVSWLFCGIKLYLVINDQGKLRALCLTPGAGDDRHPLPRLACRLFGKLFGASGYI